jgi:hypothetical protein
VELIGRHPRASVFHTVAWLESLRRTYGYQPIVYTTSPAGADLENGIVCCRVSSWITGRRLVSLPFADHCEFLIRNSEDERVLLSHLEKRLRQELLRYIEVRPMRGVEAETSLFRWDQTYAVHHLDLTPDLATLFGNCHKSSTQRKIRRAQRDGLVYQEGRSEPLLDAFCDLLLLTRRRHHVPMQPKSWFRNLIDCFGEALKIRVAFKGNQAVAAILTLRHKDALVFKYGCSDSRFHNLGGTHLLFWQSILDAKSEGLRVFEMGRSDSENAGLVKFKDRWGAARSTIYYSRFTASRVAQTTALANRKYLFPASKLMFRYIPDGVLRLLGEALYKHIG